MPRTPPNAIGVNILDTAQLDVGYVVELVERFDMAQVTIVEATHPKEAFNLATTLLAKRPHMDVFYRRKRDHLPDERMPAMVTPTEWVRYMQDALEAGMVCAVYNESQQSPMTPLTKYGTDIIGLTAPRGWRTVHFKTATGTPKGYNGEQPDGYAESDDLWKAAAAANQPRIDSGQKPLVHMAPHAYFPRWGIASGHTDRPAEILRRLKAFTPPIDPRYVPISIGETGGQVMRADGHIDDAEAGYVGYMGSETYAVVSGDVIVKVFVPLNATGHFFGLGDQQNNSPIGAQWRRFDLYKNTVFWDKLETLAADGRFRLHYWYGKDFENMTTLPSFPADFDSRAKLYNVSATDGTTIVRANPAASSTKIGEITTTQRVLKLIDEADLKPAERVQQTIGGRTSVWLPLVFGAVKAWAFKGYLNVQPVVVIPPVEEPPKPVKVKWTVVITAEHEGTVEEREASKQSYAALADFLRGYVNPIGYENPEITFAESDS